MSLDEKISTCCIKCHIHVIILCMYVHVILKLHIVKWTSIAIFEYFFIEFFLFLNCVTI